jgi:3-deoxy-D-manno-octulosonic acid (KDO) 8-phosphate synthase
MRVQLAWLDQSMDEFEAQLRLQVYLEAGFDPELAAAAASAEIHLDEMNELRARIEHLEQTVSMILDKLDELEAKYEQ